MPFYEYEFCRAKSWRFIGDSPEEIIEGINSLNSIRPKEDQAPLGEIKPVDKVELSFVFPCSTTRFAKCEILPDLIIHVNSNAFDYVRKLRSASTRFGPLYGFQNTHIHNSFIPERIAEAIFNYDWRPHIAEMDQDFARRETRLEDSVNSGRMIRIK